MSQTRYKLPQEIRQLSEIAVKRYIQYKQVALTNETDKWFIQAVESAINKVGEEYGYTEIKDKLIEPIINGVAYPRQYPYERLILPISRNTYYEMRRIFMTDIAISLGYSATKSIVKTNYT